MTHAPATIKGLLRKKVVQVVETIIGVAFIIGALFLICSAVSLVQMFAGV